jgi:hypothetical protein
MNTLSGAVKFGGRLSDPERQRLISFRHCNMVMAPAGMCSSPAGAMDNSGAVPHRRAGSIANRTV